MKGEICLVTPPARTTPPVAPVVKATLPEKVANILQKIMTDCLATEFGFASAAATISFSLVHTAFSPNILHKAE